MRPRNCSHHAAVHVSSIGEGLLKINACDGHRCLVLTLRDPRSLVLMRDPDNVIHVFELRDTIRVIIRLS